MTDDTTALGIMRRGQRSGHCTCEVLRLYTKEKMKGQKNKEGEPLYQAIRDRMFIAVLHQYADQLTKKGILPKDPKDSAYAPTNPSRAFKQLQE